MQQIQDISIKAALAGCMQLGSSLLHLVTINCFRSLRTSNGPPSIPRVPPTCSSQQLRGLLDDWHWKRFIANAWYLCRMIQKRYLTPNCPDQLSFSYRINGFGHLSVFWFTFHPRCTLSVFSFCCNKCYWFSMSFQPRMIFVVIVIFVSLSLV